MTSVSTSLETLPSFQEIQPLQLVKVKRNGGEQAFDRAIHRGDLRDARALITELVNQAQETMDRGYYPENLVRLLLKELALPLYALDRSDRGGMPLATTSEDIANVYLGAVALIDYLKSIQPPRSSSHVDKNSIGSHISGNLSEVTVFALTTRPIVGSDDDVFNILPSDFNQDHAESSSTKSTINHSIDFITTERETGDIIPLQVKTSGIWTDKRYHPSIAVAKLSDIAGGNTGLINSLQKALIAEVSGNPNAVQMRHIESSSQHLHDTYYHYLGHIALENN